MTLAISGSIQRLPSTTRLTLNLVDAARLTQIGSRTIDIALGREVITQDTVISAAIALLALELETKAAAALAAGGTAATGATLFVTVPAGASHARGPVKIAIPSEDHDDITTRSQGEGRNRSYNYTVKTSAGIRAKGNSDPVLIIDN